MGAVRLAAGGVDFGVDQAGPDRGDADAFGGDLVAEPDREGVDRALGGGVVDIGVAASRVWPRPTTTLTIAPPSPPCAGRHPLHRLAGAQDAADDVDAIIRWIRSADISSTRDGRSDDAGIVDQRAEPAEARRPPRTAPRCRPRSRRRISPRWPRRWRPRSSHDCADRLVAGIATDLSAAAIAVPAARSAGDEHASSCSRQPSRRDNAAMDQPQRRARRCVDASPIRPSDDAQHRGFAPAHQRMPAVTVSANASSDASKHCVRRNAMSSQYCSRLHGSRWPRCTAELASDDAGADRRFDSCTDPEHRANGRSWRDPHDRRPSQIQHQPRRIFQAFLDAHQEGHRLLAVDDAVVVG